MERKPMMPRRFTDVSKDLVKNTQIADSAKKICTAELRSGEKGLDPSYLTGEKIDNAMC